MAVRFARTRSVGGGEGLSVTAALRDAVLGLPELMLLDLLPRPGFVEHLLRPVRCVCVYACWSACVVGLFVQVHMSAVLKNSMVFFTIHVLALA